MQAEAFVPGLVPGREGGQRGKGTEASHSRHTHTKKLLIVYPEFKLNWVSLTGCTFSGSPTPESNFVTAFVKCVNPGMRELVARRPLEVPDQTPEALLRSAITCLLCHLALSLGLGRAFLYMGIEV